MMTEENKLVLKKRFKSLLWRAGMMLAALAVDFILQNLGLVSMPGQVTIVIGLILGEISKYLNKNAK